jgi:hypothetical protein
MAIDQSMLWNDIQEGQTYPHNEKWYSHLLDQYKLYVEMADRISQRRTTANSYFLSVNSAILAFVGYLTQKDSTEFLWLLAVAGGTLTLLDGLPSWVRTSDPQLRRLMLYPTELWAESN